MSSLGQTSIKKPSDPAIKGLLSVRRRFLFVENRLDLDVAIRNFAVVALEVDRSGEIGRAHV